MVGLSSCSGSALGLSSRLPWLRAQTPASRGELHTHLWVLLGHPLEPQSLQASIGSIVVPFKFCGL